MLHFPKGWQLPQNSTTVGTKSYSNLLFQAGVIGKIDGSGYADGGFEKLTSSPMSFLHAGYHTTTGTSVSSRGSLGNYWSKSSSSTTNAYNLNFNSSNVNPRNNNTKANGLTVRCVAL